MGRERGWELAPRGPICDCEAPPEKPYAALTAERWLRRDRTQGIAGDGERRYKALDAARAFRDGPEALEKLVCLVLPIFYSSAGIRQRKCPCHGKAGPETAKL